jgi:hypothetical protein
MWNLTFNFILLKTNVDFTSVSRFNRCEKPLYHFGAVAKPMWNLFFFFFRFWHIIYHIFSCITKRPAVPKFFFHIITQTTIWYLNFFPYHRTYHKHIYNSNNNCSKLNYHCKKIIASKGKTYIQKISSKLEWP